MTDAQKLQLAQTLMSDAQRRKLEELIKFFDQLLKEELKKN